MSLPDMSHSIKWAMKKGCQTILWLLLCIQVSGQQKVSLDGYVSDMQSFYLLKDNSIIWENLLHRRLNFDYYPFDWLKVSLQERTRFIQGNSLKKFPGYAEMLGMDAGWIDLTFADAGSYNDEIGFAYASRLDRAYAEITAGNFVATIGRQRINWGQTFVWNPNDLFNSYSYFDVDYPERPGSDALRLQYYTGTTSILEIAAKTDSANKVTAASYYRFNAGNYDIQILGGILEEADVVIGGGWSGNIGNMSFRGEASYFRDLKSFSDTSGNFMVSLGFDRTFGSSLWIQGEVLYSGFAKDQTIHSLMQMLGANMNIKRLGFTQWSLFGSVSYPFTPLINASLAGIYFPEWKGFYLGPSFEFSLSNSVSASLIMQAFSAELEDPSGMPQRENTYIAYARIKWSF